MDKLFGGNEAVAGGVVFSKGIANFHYRRRDS